MSHSADSPQSSPDLRESSNSCAAWQSLLERIPYAVHLGLHVQQNHSEIQVCLPYRESLIGNFMLPALHGGVLGALIEITARVAAQREDAEGRCPRILDSNINYLRSAQAQPTFASAEIVRQGRRTSLVQVSCWQDEKNAPNAIGRVQLLFPTTAARQGVHER
ncbi:PaaI family thioesterase [Hydrocarboniclastica marina]|uniref:PaaI family thioesterase n=1 Tax=Hydrocarboniclastica marina TaxID=2259620 RepID=A0A4V1D9B1_9ALTE|nr:PaaI family thioesterase [Hydrocarboniclastica marina]MAM59860.1 thioesterase [Maritimibacter sp.]QCF28070.1 PaaI family thioesterase [Hydrocarboniclastica marina]